MLDLFDKVAEAVADGVSAAVEGAADGVALGARALVAGAEVAAGAAVGTAKILGVGNGNAHAFEAFKNHKATLSDLGTIQVLDWSEPGTVHYRVRYVFDLNGGRIYISGDLGAAVVNPTWYPTFAATYHSVADRENPIDVNEGYFLQKVEASSDRYVYDRDAAELPGHRERGRRPRNRDGRIPRRLGTTAHRRRGARDPGGLRRRLLGVDRGGGAKHRREDLPVAGRPEDGVEPTQRKGRKWKTDMR